MLNTSSRSSVSASQDGLSRLTLVWPSPSLLLADLVSSVRISSPESPGLVPHYAISGNPQAPEVLSDKVILTPIAPGNLRGALWAESPLQATAWMVDVDFRASGPDRGSGIMSIWLVHEGSKAVGSNSIYTVGAFDGLCLVVDTYGGSGGRIRGFLNDGTVDYAHQPSVDKLAFGHCPYSYRNLGRPSQIKMRQTSTSFRVEVDGQLCFETDKASLPSGNFLGITAATPDTPDSFEIFKIIATTTPPAQGEKVEPVPRAASIPDKAADNFQSSKEQFRDLHDRLQAASHQVEALMQTLSKQVQLTEKRHDEVRSMLESMRHELANLRQAQDSQAGGVSRLETEVRKVNDDIHHKLSAYEQSVRGSLSSHHDTLSRAMLDSMPGHGKLIFVFIGTQLVLVLAYIAYKRRRANSPKKFL